MLPTVTVDRIGRPFVQCALALGLILLAGAHHANHGLIALSWAVPQLIGAVIGLWCFWGLLLKAERRDRRANGKRDGRPTRVLAVKFWRFTTPRGMAGIFQIVVLWFDTLLV